MILENVYYINLDERPDRKVKIEKQLDQLGWKYERFSAIKDKLGAVGCSKSHLALFQLAKEKNLPYVVILEDDMTIIDINLFQTQLEKIWNSDIEYDVLLLGGNSYPDPKYEYITDFCMRTFNCQCCLAYVVNNNMYDKLIENFKESIEKYQNTNNHAEYSCDQYWKKLQKENKFLFLLPPLITQIKGDQSNIVNWRWDSDIYMLNIEKKWLGYSNPFINK